MEWQFAEYFLIGAAKWKCVAFSRSWLWMLPDMSEMWSATVADVAKMTINF